MPNKFNKMRLRTIIATFLIALFITGSIGLIEGYQDYLRGNLGTVQPSPSPTKPAIDQPSPPEIKERISLGGNNLITVGSTKNKQAGIKAFASDDFDKAQKEFSLSLISYPNDPEARIYLANTKVINRDVVRISIVISSRNPEEANESLRGAAQGQDEINSTGGINGKPVQIAIADDNGDPEISKQIAAELVKDPKVMAIIGPTSIEASLEAAPEYQKGKMVFIPLVITHEKLYDSRFTNIFRVIPSTRSISDTLVKHTHDRDIDKVAFCFDSSDEDSQSFKDQFSYGFVVELGTQMIDINCDFSKGIDPSKVLAEAINKGAKALLLVPSSQSMSKAMEIVVANSQSLPLLANPTMFSFKTLLQGGPGAIGMVLPVIWDEKIASPSFLNRVRKLWGVGDISWRTALAYDATRLAIEASKSGTNRQDVQKKLFERSSSVLGSTKKAITFFPSGDRDMTSIIVKIQRKKNSERDLEFVPD